MVIASVRYQSVRRAVAITPRTSPPDPLRIVVQAGALVAAAGEIVRDLA